MLASAIPDDPAIPALGTAISRHSNWLPDARFDTIARLAQRHFKLAAAIITSLDPGPVGAWAQHGVPIDNPAEISAFCTRVLTSQGVLIEIDASGVAPSSDGNSTQGLPQFRCCIGIPLLSVTGEPLGTLCLFAATPQGLDDAQQHSLRDFAALASNLIEQDAANAREQLEHATLRASERRMALAIAGSDTGIWDRNVLTGEIHYSEGWKSILGYSESDISNQIRESYTRVHPDDLPYVKASIQAHFDGHTENYEVEHRIRCKDGSYKWISSRGRVVERDKNGLPRRMIGTTTDITTMRNISERLRQTANLVTNLTNEVPGLVFQYQQAPDGASRFSYASAGIEDIYEISANLVAASDAAIDRVIHPDDLALYRDSLAASAAALTPWHLEYRVQLPRQGLRWRQGDARPSRLPDGGTLWHGFITDVTERKRIEAELQEFATIDFLTQLPNRRHFMTQLNAALTSLNQEMGQSSAILMCDLDYFKSINDQWGHAVGDLALTHFAMLLRSQLRKEDLVGRVGGEEFAVALDHSNLDDAIAFAHRLQRHIADSPLICDGQSIALTVSIGIALMNAGDTNADLALTRSDLALYRAKSSGRNRIECH